MGPAGSGPLPVQGRPNWRRMLFPSIWLGYLAQTAAGVHRHQVGWWVVVGYALIVAFAVCYLVAIASRWGGSLRAFRVSYAVAVLLFFGETALAREDAFVMCLFLTVLAVANGGRAPVVMVAAMTALAAFGPAAIPAWHTSVQMEWLFTVPLVAMAMWAFFGIIASHQELVRARAEVARLAAENERTRIARDLHDLLGHSLTTITVKAGLARRLAERGQRERAAVEIGEVERLSRRTLTDVRAAVSGQRTITLANELATAREVLRATGIVADLPGSVDIVDPRWSELFGWVLREGMTNVVRHSRATHCAVTFGPGCIEIDDDGHGGAVPATAGTGLAGLRERVAAAGGTLDAGPRAPGWRLRVTVPVPNPPTRAVAAAEVRQ